MLKKPCKEPLGLVEILRFPTDLKGEEGENLKRRLLLFIQATTPVFELITSPQRVRCIRCKAPEFAISGFENMLEDWITDLISDPKPNLLKKPISTEQKEYTIALMDRGIVYTGVFPISNRPDGEGYYYFVFDKSIEL